MKHWLSGFSIPVGGRQNFFVVKAMVGKKEFFCIAGPPP